MSDLKKLKNLKQVLSAELERRPAEEREKFTEEAKREEARLTPQIRKAVFDALPAEQKLYLMPTPDSVS
jgi:hypothetical protein